MRQWKVQDCSKLSQTIKLDLAHSRHHILFKQLFHEPLWKSVNLSSRSQRGGGLDVWQMWLRLAEAGRRAAQPQTPTETVTEWAKAEHSDLDLTEFRQRHTLSPEEVDVLNKRRTRHDIAQVCVHLPTHTPWNIQTLGIILLKRLLTHLFAHFVPQSTERH